MFKNYIKIAWRNFIRNRSFSLINIIGLAIALVVFLFILLFVRHELSYDKYHPEADNIYRVTISFEKDDYKSKTLATPNLLGPSIKEDISGINDFTRINTVPGDVLVQKENEKYFEDGLIFADQSIFDLFYFEFLHGDEEAVLSRPFTLVITQSTARKYFGDENPIGKNLNIETWGQNEYEIVGVIKDTPSNTHLAFDFLTSTRTFRSVVPNPEGSFESWYHVGAYTYLKLEEGVNQKRIEDQFPKFIQSKKGERGSYESLILQPITDIHLYSDFDREIKPNSDIRYIYIFGSISFLILIIAGINYVNLATAKSVDRALEIGIRKTLGISKYQIFVQFFVESSVLSGIAMIIAFFLAELFLPMFNAIAGLELTIPYFTIEFILGSIFFIIIFSFFSGFYPSLILSRYNPAWVIKGAGSQRKKSILRNGLIVFQFCVSIALISSTIIIHQQMEYVRNKKLGLNSNQVVIVKADGGLRSNFSTFKDELLKSPAVENVTYTTHAIPVRSDFTLTLYPEGGSPDNNSFMAVGPDFLETMEISLLAGKRLDDFSNSREDNIFPVLINETAMKEFGWQDNPIGQKLQGFSPTPEVVGVVEDFHFESFKQNIKPLVMGAMGGPRNIYVRTKTENIASTLDYFKGVWDELGPGTPMVYSFLDKQFESLYEAEDKLASLFSYFTMFGIFIACLGLFGLAAFSAERRSKEIGIRKVLGASIANIIALLSKDFVKLIMIGFLIAIPIAWYAMNQWLMDFAYHIEIRPGIFALAGGAALVIALLTVSWQSVRAAVANPVESLRSE